MAQLVTVLLAFGSNLGDRVKTIRDAQRDLKKTQGISELRVSPLRETIAFGIEGPDPEAPKYLNGVATLVTSMPPEELLQLTQSLENKYGRTREARWGDRTLDIDIILYGGRVVKTDDLILPHPRAHERDFVLSPWIMLDENAVLMGHGRVKDVLQRISDTTLPYTGPDSLSELE